jgi:hypothetical protein
MYFAAAGAGLVSYSAECNARPCWEVQQCSVQWKRNAFIFDGALNEVDAHRSHTDTHVGGRNLDALVHVYDGPSIHLSKIVYALREPYPGIAHIVSLQK